MSHEHLIGKRFCGTPDKPVGLASVPCRWDDTDWDGTKYVGPRTAVTRKFFVAGAAPGITLADTRRATQQAFDEIAKHAPVFGVETLVQSEANIVIKFGPIDGPSKILAQTELPCGPDSPSRVLSFIADSSEQWTYDFFCTVLTHELGHFWGLEHGPTGNLMAPYYDPSISTFQTWDVQQIQSRYGNFQGTTPTPVPPTPTPISITKNVSLTIDSETWTGTLTKTSS